MIHLEKNETPAVVGADLPVLLTLVALLVVLMLLICNPKKVNPDDDPTEGLSQHLLDT